jgi:hypothetical protein
VGLALAVPPFDRYPRPSATLSHRVSVEEMHTLLEDAGFEATRVEVLQSEQRFATPEEAIRFGEASSFGNLLGHMPVELRPAARERIASRLAAVMGPEGFVQPRQRLVVVGQKR